jgi:hypothetical protein
MRIAEAVDWYLAGTDRSGRGGPPRGSRRGARKGKADARPWVLCHRTGPRRVIKAGGRAGSAV